jgi:hypothetical protein
MNSKDAQILKYGGIEGYRAEMKRRRSMVKKTTGFGTMDVEFIRAAQLKGAKTRAKRRQHEKDRIKAENASQGDKQETA